MWNILTVDRKITEGRGGAGCDFGLAGESPDGWPAYVELDV